MQFFTRQICFSRLLCRKNSNRDEFSSGWKVDIIFIGSVDGTATSCASERITQRMDEIFGTCCGCWKVYGNFSASSCASPAAFFLLDKLLLFFYNSHTRFSITEQRIRVSFVNNNKHSQHSLLVVHLWFFPFVVVISQYNDDSMASQYFDVPIGMENIFKVTYIYSIWTSIAGNFDSRSQKSI